MADFERVLVPGLTHWNHPGFFAYFAITGSAPGVLAEFLSAALNQQAMLWRTSPAATELEAVSLGWLRQLIGLPDAFEGVIYDTASIATMHALVAAREAAVPTFAARGLAGRSDVPPLRIYCSDQAHSASDKSVIAIGLGHDALRKIPVDADYRMRPDALERRDRRGSRRRHPADRRRRHRRHDVDDEHRSGAGDRRHLRARTALAARGRRVRRRRGDAAVARHILRRRRSRRLVRRQPAQVAVHAVRPERVLLPADGRDACGILADAGIPANGRNGPGGDVKNLMDTGVQLGRRFRALKLWMILRSFGARAIREHLAEHIRLAQEFASWVDAHPDFERLAPVPFSVVCFRWKPAARNLSPAELDAANERLIDLVNQTGEVFLSHTRLREGLALRLAIGHLHTTETHVRRAWDLLVECSGRSRGGSDETPFRPCGLRRTRHTHFSAAGRCAAHFSAAGRCAAHLSAAGRAPPGAVLSSLAGDPVLVGAGDIADCGTTTDSATAALLDTIDGTVFAAGDNAYLLGSAEDYANCYELTWGRHKARTRPAPGNHDYLSPEVAPYYVHFGAHAGPAGRGYYEATTRRVAHRLAQQQRRGHHAGPCTGTVVARRPGCQLDPVHARLTGNTPGSARGSTAASSTCGTSTRRSTSSAPTW